MPSAPVERLTSKRVQWLSRNRCKHGHSYLEHFGCFRKEYPDWKMPKRVLVTADLHCGHRIGLTPPEYNPIYPFPIDESDLRSKLWKLYSDKVNELKPIDLTISNGDAIDGKGEKSGGTEQLIMDRNMQIKMALSVLKHTEAKQYVLVYGTPYHTGKDEDYERQLADHLGCLIKSHAFIDVNGCGIDCKHKIGSSQIPHGRVTPLLRDKIWADIWHDVGVNPKSHIIIRSHVHYYEQVENAQCTAVITPALQGLGSKYGTRECAGLVNWGFIWIDIESAYDYEVKAYIPKEANEMQKVEVIKI